MKMNTYNTRNETEAVALVKFFNECGYTANRKGLVVKVCGEPNMVNHLFEVFVINALV